MAKIKVSRYNVEDILRLILMMCVLLSILNGVSYQDVWADTKQEPPQETTKELAPMPAPADVYEQDSQAKPSEGQGGQNNSDEQSGIQDDGIADTDNQDEIVDQDSQQELTQKSSEGLRVTPQPDDGPVVITSRVTAGRIIPVNMAQFFFVMIIGMAGIKLVLVMATKVGLK